MDPEAIAAFQRLGKHVVAEIADTTQWNLADPLVIKHIDTGVDQSACTGRYGCLLAKACNEIVCVRLDGPLALQVRGLIHGEGGGRVQPSVLGYERRKGFGGEHIPIEHEKRTRTQVGERVPYSAGGAQELVLDDHYEIDRSRIVSRERHDLLMHMARINHNAGDRLTFKIHELAREERLASDIDERLGNISRYTKQPCTPTRRKEHDIHRGLRAA
jgi:hypothetical protein